MPLLQVRVCPTAGVPLITGGSVLAGTWPDGPETVTGSVVIVVLPAEVAAVTVQVNDAPTSSLSSVYVVPVPTAAPLRRHR